jgi:DNA-directed RNA polymerase subunit RPC12/RpoP
MKTSDYKCNNCNQTTTLSVIFSESFPPKINCQYCNSKAIRIYSIPVSIIQQGKCGNSKNGYTSNNIKIKKT